MVTDDSKTDGANHTQFNALQEQLLNQVKTDQEKLQVPQIAIDSPKYVTYQNEIDAERALGDAEMN